MRNIHDLFDGFSPAADVDAQPASYLQADQRTGTAPNGKPSKTIDEAGYHLIGGAPGWSSALGVGFTVTYAFRSTAPASMPSDTSGFSRFNAAQIAQAELALKAWSDVANITFVRVGSGASGEGAYSNSASILLGNYSAGASGAAAFAYYPGDTSYASSSGDVWVNSTLSYNSAPTGGNYGGLVLVHELGHTIGLSHPGDYDASDGVFTYANDAEYYEDSYQYTVMSYFNEGNTGANYQGAYAASPMLDDISAAQQEYGVNTATRTGDTVYGFNSTADRPWFLATGAATKLIFAVWDAGGNDTLDFSGYGVAQTIDLREGNFSDVGGMVGNVAVAKGAQIENAIGGSTTDVIIGNALNNHLEGRAGADVLYGSSGDDVLDGGSGSNTLDGGDGQDWVISQEGADRIAGGDGADTLWAGPGDDLIDGGLGDDTIDGGAGTDTVTYANAPAGVEIDLRIIEEQLTRGAGVDTLISIENVIGSAFADVLTGKAGTNVFTGGAGDDRFVFYVGAGADRVTDFGANGAHDLLDMSSVIAAGVTWTITQAAADTVISLTSGDSITLTAFDHTHLQTSGDFLMAV